ncbi:hypothetical protein V1514DRAFT_336869 [Lipomyces japonicus]|uniref:uncharacterized protein n=1 Tax=Lipomyces japonicus TaxID=56871 RepID=UPI0034CFABA1
MGTVSLLTSDLAALLSETKRRNTDLRQACEKSLSDIKSLVGSSKNESEILLELAASPTFAIPFLLACSTRNVKSCAIAVQGLQRLITSHRLNKTNLPQLLEAFEESTHLGVEIQLKILQSLPPLIERYGNHLGGEKLAKTIGLCSILQGSKIAVVANTAAATLQQLSIAIFDEVSSEDKLLGIEPEFEVPIGDGKSSGKVKPTAYDAFRVFQDICLLTEGNKSFFLANSHITETFGLELIESIISNHSQIFNEHPEQTYILRTYVFPYILRSLSERREFPIIVRVIRILYLILRRHLAILPVECEVALTLLTHMLDADYAPYWKRVLALEVFQGIFAEYSLVRKMYLEYDFKDGRQNIVRQLITSINKLSAEKPDVIGLRRSSTSMFIPKDGNLESGLGESAVGGLFGGPGADNNVLSVQTSSVRILCIDQLDKSEPPAMPDSYLYYLSLTCVNSLADGLTRFLLPLSLPNPSSTLKNKPSRSFTTEDKENLDKPDESLGIQRLPKRRTTRYRGMPINPLTVENHLLKVDIESTAGIVKDCWPPLLAAFSTFLYSNLDSDLYHNLVRSFQKFTQSAGILELVTPRDAFLTTLAKVAVPSQIFTGTQSAAQSPTNERFNSLIFNNPIGKLGGSESSTKEQSQTLEGLHGTLHVRNLLCLRALLNLAIALGPTLKSSWSIIIETLQQADFVLNATSRRYGGKIGKIDHSASNGNGEGSAGIISETTAVHNAVRKLMECTRDFPDESFVDLVNALCKVSVSTINIHLDDLESHSSPSLRKPNAYPESSKSSNTSSQKQGLNLGRLSLVHGDSLFALIRLGELADLNIKRLVTSSPESSGWDAFVKYFILVASSREINTTVRLRAAEVLDSTIFAAVVEASNDSNDTDLEVIHRRSLIAIEEQMYSIIRQGDPSSEMELSIKATEADIHCTALNTLNNILDRTGSSLANGWEIVFSILTSVFVMHHHGNLLPTTIFSGDASISDVISKSKSHFSRAEGGKTQRLIKAAFGSLQLIGNDFLSVIPQNCFLSLIDLLYYFCQQHEDLNISLTTITFFWTVSDFLRAKLTENGTSSDLSQPLNSKNDLLTSVKSNDFSDSATSLWLILLLRLTAVSSDLRPDVRNGAIQILFRIFDSYGHHLGVNAWNACIWIVIHTIMEVRPPLEIPLEVGDSTSLLNARDAERKQWSETMALILAGLGRLYSTFLPAFSRQPDFAAIWNLLHTYLHSMICIGRSEIILSVFKALSDILISVDESKAEILLPNESLDETWTIWSSQEQIILESEKNSTGVMDQDAITAYVISFKPLYSLICKRITVAQIQKLLDILKSCLLFPKLPPYFSDLDYLTPLQSAIIDVVKRIKSDMPGTASLILRSYSEFSSLAYRDNIPSAIPVRQGKSKKPTYISISVHCFELILQTVKANLHDEQIFKDGSVAYALKMLGIPIAAKYNCPSYATTGDKSLTLWMLASNTFIEIVHIAIDIGEKNQNVEIPVDQKLELWTQIVDGTSSIVKANVSSGSSLIEDEKFDIEAFHKLESLILPYLGDADLPDFIIEKYVDNLFLFSFVYEIAAVNEDKDKDVQHRLTAVFKGPFHGSTDGLKILPRPKMAYVAFASLFKLCTIEAKDSSQRTRLASIAIPYLLLRCALVLQIFAADQPLRGTIPIPKLQRKEIIYILNSLIKLSEHWSDNDKLDGTAAVDISKYKPLWKLFPLLSKGIVASKSDPIVLELLQASFEKIGGGFEIKS